MRRAAAIVLIVAIYLAAREVIGHAGDALWRWWPDPDWFGSAYYWIWVVVLAGCAARWPHAIPRVLPARDAWTRANVIVVIAAVVVNESFYGWRSAALVTGDAAFCRPQFLTNAILLAPLVEEWLFRGVLWDAIATRLSGAAAVLVPLLITSVLFGAWHWASILSPSWTGVGGTPLLVHVAYGVFLGLVRWRFRAIGVGVLLHSVGNGWSSVTVSLPSG